jgi:hypothetical protein
LTGQVSVAARCVICGTFVEDDGVLVLVIDDVRRAHCSDSCLHSGIAEWRLARRDRTRVRILLSLLFVALLGGAGLLWRLFHGAQVRPIVAAPPAPARGELPMEPPSLEPEPYGPRWPPTDADWQEQFRSSTWVYPLPGPVRSEPRIDAAILGSERSPALPAACRESRRCTVLLGGELWGEHVYAAHDGVVVDVRRSERNGDGGGVSVRLSHWGGVVFTQYFHLAAVPRHLIPGMAVTAGYVIGLLGDTGTEGAPQLRFALSIKLSSAFPEVYWDPRPFMADWPLHVPARGSVAGLASLTGSTEHVGGVPMPRPQPSRFSGKASPRRPAPASKPDSAEQTD